jgi:hypothetical protein
MRTRRGVADLDCLRGETTGVGTSSSVEQRSITPMSGLACLTDRVLRLVLRRGGVEVLRAGPVSVLLLRVVDDPCEPWTIGARDEEEVTETETEEGGARRTFFLILSIVGRGSSGGGGVNVESLLDRVKGELDSCIANSELDVRLGIDGSLYSISSSSSSGVEARVGTGRCVKNDLKASAFSPPVPVPLPFRGAVALILALGFDFGLAFAACSSS